MQTVDGAAVEAVEGDAVRFKDNKRAYKEACSLQAATGTRPNSAQLLEEKKNHFAK